MSGKGWRHYYHRTALLAPSPLPLSLLHQPLSLCLPHNMSCLSLPPYALLSSLLSSPLFPASRSYILSGSSSSYSFIPASFPPFPLHLSTSSFSPFLPFRPSFSTFLRLSIPHSPLSPSLPLPYQTAVLPSPSPIISLQIISTSDFPSYSLPHLHCPSSPPFPPSCLFFV